MTVKGCVIALVGIALSGCVSDSAVLTNASGKSVQCANEGWGWLGAPIAMARQSDCLKKAKAAGFQQSGALTASNAPKPSALAGKLDLAFPAGWQEKALTDAQRSAGTEIFASDATTDSSVVVSAANEAELTDRNVFMLSRRAAQESQLKDASHSDIADITVNGRPAERFEVTGTSADGARYTFLDTAIFGKAQVVIVNAWTTAPNFDNQKSSLQTLAQRVSGIQ